MILRKFELLFILIIVLFSCQNNSSRASRSNETSLPDDRMVGEWVQPNPINEKEMQGFVLRKDGSAESINQATLTYRKWWCNVDSLCLVAESVGNKVSSVDTIRFGLVSVTRNELVLKDRQLVLKFNRK